MLSSFLLAIRMKNTPLLLKKITSLKQVLLPKNSLKNSAILLSKKILVKLSLLTSSTEGDKVEVVGTTKGKGFQGVVKRHGFHGVGQQSHGQHDRQRAPGSIG